MRLKCNPQQSLDFAKSQLKITKAYYAKYRAVSTILDEVLDLVGLVHRDLERALMSTNRYAVGGRKYIYTSENMLRILVCLSIEGESLRGIVVRIDDSDFLRRFVRINHGPMMDYTTLCKLKNSISEETWHSVNRRLAKHAVETGNQPARGRIWPYELGAAPGQWPGWAGLRGDQHLRGE